MIRITQHPKDKSFLLLKVPQDLNAKMGSFGPAQLARDLGGYVMAADTLGAFVSWAKFHDVQVLNEVRAVGEPTRPLECGNIAADGGKCCAPHPASRIPQFCGACGQPANPVTFDDGEPMIGVRCGPCGRVNHGGPAYCIGCGTALPEHHLAVSALPRVKAESRALGEVIGEMAELKGPPA